VKRILFLASALFAIAQLSSAATCTSGTLASYLALGSSGCTIGNDVLSNFQTLAGQTGATEIATNAVVVTPGGGTSSPSLTFTTTQSVSTGGLVESIFTYQLSAPSFISASLALSNSSETVDGGVTDIENFCAGGTFGPDGVDGCTGTAGSLLALDGVQNSDTSPLGPASFVNVTNDFTLSGGTAGSAAGGIFADSFTATPEPASLFMAALGILIATTVRMYSKRKV
jgi:hypothetical protein